MELTKLIDEWLMPHILKDKTKKIKKNSGRSPSSTDGHV